jgi:hypothetical protein
MPVPCWSARPPDPRWTQAPRSYMGQRHLHPVASRDIRKTSLTRSPPQKRSARTLCVPRRHSLSTLVPRREPRRNNHPMRPIDSINTAQVSRSSKSAGHFVRHAEFSSAEAANRAAAKRADLRIPLGAIQAFSSRSAGTERGSRIANFHQVISELPDDVSFGARKNLYGQPPGFRAPCSVAIRSVSSVSRRQNESSASKGSPDSRPSRRESPAHPESLQSRGRPQSLQRRGRRPPALTTAWILRSCSGMS